MGDITDLPHSPLPARGPWPQTFLDDIHLALLNQISYSVYRNALINGSLAVSQRLGTGVALAADGWIADRWRLEVGAGNTVSASLTPIPTFPFRLPELCPNYISFGRTVTGANPTIFRQRIENVRTLNGQESSTAALSYASFSFYALKNVTPLDYGVWLVQNFGTGGAPSAPVTTIVASGTIPASNTLARYAHSFEVPSLLSKAYGTNGDSYVELALVFPAASGNIAPAQMFLAAFQLERGVTPTQFEIEPLDVTLARCQRYAFKTYSDTVPLGTVTTAGAVMARAQGAGVLVDPMVAHFPVRMRDVPIVTWYSPATGAAGFIRDTTGPGEIAVTNTTLTGETQSGVPQVAATVAGRIYQGHCFCDAELG